MSDLLLLLELSYSMSQTNMSNVTLDNSSLSPQVIGSSIHDLPISKIHQFKVGVALVQYVLIIQVLAGTIGNILSFAVLIRRRMRSTSVNFYLACLACADTAVLLLSGFKTWLRVVSNIELLHLSGASCKILTFLFMTALHASAWFVVLVTADRFIVIYFPFRASSLCTQRRGWIISGLMMLIVVLYNIHLLWSMELFVVPPAYSMIQCAGAHGNNFMNGPYEIMKLISYSLIPFVLVLFMNIGIIFRICQQTRQPFPGDVLRSDVHQESKRLIQSRQQLTIMLLVVSFSYLILSTPFPLVSIFPVHTPDNYARAKQFLAKTVCFLLMYLNHSINFFLYCIAGKKFRSELRTMFIDMFTRCQTHHHRSSISLATSKRSKLFSRKSKQKTGFTPPLQDDVLEEIV